MIIAPAARVKNRAKTNGETKARDRTVRRVDRASRRMRESNALHFYHLVEVGGGVDGGEVQPSTLHAGFEG
jgi:hypothetical protein